MTIIPVISEFVLGACMVFMSAERADFFSGCLRRNRNKQYWIKCTQSYSSSEACKMLELCGGRTRIAFWTLGLLAFVVLIVALLQVSIGPGKNDANAIVSPWDFTKAPPDGISKSAVKTVVPGKMGSQSSHAAQSGNYKPYVQARAR
jgi:hypothetical protein